jgi:phage terminase small subunit
MGNNGRPAGVTEKTWKALHSRAKSFVESYISVGNCVQAYKNAGYALGANDQDKVKVARRAYSVLNGKRVRQALMEHQSQRARLNEAKATFALDWIVSEHERLKELAEQAGDLAVATRNLELIGRTRGVYREGLVLDVAERRQYSEAEQIEAARLARLLLMDGDAPEMLEAEAAPAPSGAQSKNLDTDTNETGKSAAKKPEILEGAFEPVNKGRNARGQFEAKADIEDNACDASAVEGDAREGISADDADAMVAEARAAVDLQAGPSAEPWDDGT